MTSFDGGDINQDSWSITITTILILILLILIMSFHY